MNFLRHYKISKKIMVLQIVVVIFMLAVGLTGFLNMTKMKANSDQMYEDRLLSQEQKRGIKQKINDLLKKTDELIKQYESMPMDDVEQRKFTDYKKTLNEYRNELLVVMQEAELNNQKEAYDEYVNYLYSMRTSVTTLLNQLVDHNVMISKELNDESTALSQTAYLIIIVMTVLAIVFAVLVGMLITRMITGPIREMQQLMNKAGGGDLTVRGTYRSKDEIGSLTSDFNKMMDGLLEVVTKVNISANQLSVRAVELSANAEQTVHVAHQIAESIQEVAAGAETQAAGASESVKAMGEMAIGIERIAESSSTVSEASVETAREAALGNEAIQKVVHQMDSIRVSVTSSSHAVKELGARSKEIGQIVAVIVDIAAQTNLLALNAAIEAARAGEHGRGFAVVADEVRKLAEESRLSADQITTLITEIQSDTGKVVTAIEKGNTEVDSGIRVVQEAGEAFQKILRSVQHVSDQIQEVSAASEEMSAGAEEVTASVEAMARIAIDSSQHSQSVVAASQEQFGIINEISSSVQSLSEMAKELDKVVKQFKLE